MTANEKPTGKYVGRSLLSTDDPRYVRRLWRILRWSDSIYSPTLGRLYSFALAFRAGNIIITEGTKAGYILTQAERDSLTDGNCKDICADRII